MKKSYLCLLTVAMVIASIVITGCTTSNQANQASSSETSTNATTSLTTTAAASKTAITSPTVTPLPSASPTAATPTPSGMISTSIQFDSDPGSVQRGQTISLGVEVIAPTSSQPMVCGHGTIVVLKADGTALGTVTSGGSSADCFKTAFYTLDTSSLNPGTYVVTLKFTGDSTYQPSQSTSKITITA